MAKFINWLLEIEAYGAVWQVACPEVVTKRNLLHLLKGVFNRPTYVDYGRASKDVNKSLCPMVDFGYSVPPLKKMLIDLKKWMEAHPELYKDYYDFIQEK